MLGPELFLGRQRRDRGTELLLGREQCNRFPQLLFGREGLELLLRREGLELLLCREGLEVALGRKGWQNLLYLLEATIEVFEMCSDHVVIHRPHLLDADSGE